MSYIDNNYIRIKYDSFFFFIHKYKIIQYDHEDKHCVNQSVNK